MFFLTSSILQRAKTHPRGLFIGATLLIWLLIILSFLLHGYAKTWQLWNIDVSMHTFLDFRFIPGSAETLRMGLDPMERNPGDPLGRLFNYPDVWYLVLRTGISQADTIWIVISMIILFFVTVLMFSDRPHALDIVLMLAVLFSPAAMLLYERGNVDLMFFSLCALAITTASYSSAAAFLLILAASVFKLFPFLGMSIFLKEDRKASAYWLLAGCAAFGTYCFLSLVSLRTAWALTQRGWDTSYGTGVLVTRFNAILTDLLSQYLSPHNVSQVLALGPSLVASLLIVLTLFTSARRRYTLTATSQRNLSAFRMGATIYVGTFLVGHNWDYRLTFLVFAVPQMSEWIRDTHGQVRWIVMLSMSAVLLSCWYMFYGYSSNYRAPLDDVHKVLFSIDEFVNWSLVAGFVVLLFASFPDWIKSFVFRLVPAREATHRRMSPGGFGAVRARDD